MILIGSRALAIRAPFLIGRKPVDFDWICTKDEFDVWLKNNKEKVEATKIYELPDFNKWVVEGSTNCEFEIIKPGSSSELFNDIVISDNESIETSFGMIPNIDLLFTIKSSHKYKKFKSTANIFWKTAIDYHTMKCAGAQVRTEYLDFFHLREKETYNYSHPKLNQNKDNFFADDNIAYEVDHDDIHVSVARFDKPAYLYYIKDGEQVQCDKNKFFNCSREIQFAGVIEEAAVLAIERSLIPHPGFWSPEYAWKFALAKVCSSITSGWFREFAYENLPLILKLYPVGYWEKFQQDMKNGKIKPFTGRRY